MRQLMLVAPGRVEWRHTADPALTGPDAALVRPVAVSVCDFDRALISGVLDVLPMPIVLGHEIVAEVLEIGSAVRGVAVGERVILPLQISCGSCAPCHAGRTNSCAAVPRLANYGLGAGSGDYGGGMSDVLIAPYADAMLVAVPPALSPIDCVAIGCNLVDVYRCLAQPLTTFPGADLLVVGGHGVSFALYTVAMAHVLGAGTVDFVSDDSHQRARAKALGARPLNLDGPLRKGGYPLVCDLSLNPQHLALGAAACAPDGTCMVPWFYPAPGAMLPLHAMFRNNVSLITGQPHARGLIEPVLELVETGVINSTTVPSEILDWDQAETTYGNQPTKQIFVR